MEFNAWLQEHKDELIDLLRNDQEEALFMAWLAGYSAGGNFIGNIFKTRLSK